MKKVFKSMLFVAMSLIVAVGLTACSEDEVKPTDKTKELVGPKPAKVVIKASVPVIAVESNLYKAPSPVIKVIKAGATTVTSFFIRSYCLLDIVISP